MPEVRLIDANALIEFFEHLIEKTILEDTKIHYALAIETVKAQPTIEAEPVRHGRMIEGRYPNENKCSECGQVFRDDIGFIIQDDDGVFHYPKRCPECGCYWDGGADNG